MHEAVILYMSGLSYWITTCTVFKLQNVVIDALKMMRHNVDVDVNAEKSPDDQSSLEQVLGQTVPVRREKISSS